MATTVFSHTQSGNTGDVKESTSYRTLSLSSGSAIPSSGVKINSVTFYCSLINQYSSKSIYLYEETLGRMSDDFAGASGGTSISAGMYTTLSYYAGKSSLNVKLVVTSPGTGSVFNVRDGAVWSVSVDWAYNYTNCTAPTKGELTTYLANTGSSAYLSFSGATAGTGLSIKHYQIGYTEYNASGVQVSSNDDYIKTPKTSEIPVSPSTTEGHYMQYRIKTIASVANYDSGWYTLTNRLRTNSSPRITGITAVPALYESGNITLTFAGVSDADNNINTLNLWYRYDGGAWVEFAKISNAASYVFAPPFTFERGKSAYFAAKVVDLLGKESIVVDQSGNTGVFVYSGYVKKNEEPVPSTGLTADASVALNTVNLTLPTYKDEGIKNIILEMSSNNGTSYGNPVTLAATATNYAWDISSFSGGTKFKFRCRALDNLGAYSVYSISQTVLKNTPPGAVVIKSPSDKTVYNKAALLIKINVPADVEGDTMTLSYSINDQNTAFLVPTVGQDYWLQLSPVLGKNTIKLWLKDINGGVSPISQLVVNVENTNWKRSIETGVVISNETVKHSEDIAELIGKLNNVRSYYGLTSYYIASGTNLFAKWKDNMQNIFDKINETKKVTGAAFTETLSNEEYPNAADFNLLRSLIEML